MIQKTLKSVDDNVDTKKGNKKVILYFKKDRKINKTRKLDIEEMMKQYKVFFFVIESFQWWTKSICNLFQIRNRKKKK